MPVVNIPGIGDVVLVDREQLRFKRHGRQFALPRHLPGIMCAMPPAPAMFDGSKGRSIKYPVLGNNQEGDCYMADALHCIQTWTGNVSTPAQFVTSQVLALYHQLSGGDNGLSDSDIFPAWKKGLFGHKILDEMTVNPSDHGSIRFAMWKFFGASFTCSLPSGWANNANPGAVWGTGAGHAVGGHAMHWSGYGIKVVNGEPCYQDETWGIDPAVEITPEGVQEVGPEVTVQFSLDMFDPATGLAPDGESYEQKATWWVACGGNRLPVSPFPAPPTPPTPPIDWGPPVDWS